MGSDAKLQVDRVRTELLDTQLVSQVFLMCGKPTFPVSGVL